MGAAQFESQSSFEKSESYAAAMLCRTRHGTLHAGLLYKRKYEVKVLHLGWSDNLRDRWAEDENRDTPEWVRFWAAPQIHPSRLFAVSAHCTRIWKKFQQTRLMSYSLSFNQAKFRTDTGVLDVSDPAVVGVSCSTFILAVFNTMGVTLIDEGTWPIRKEADREWYGKLSQIMKDSAPFLKDEIEAGVRRIRPEEVMGACACDVVPAQFETCRTHGEVIVTMWDRYHDAANVPAAVGPPAATDSVTTARHSH